MRPTKWVQAKIIKAILSLGIASIILQEHCNTKIFSSKLIILVFSYLWNIKIVCNAFTCGQPTAWYCSDNVAFKYFCSCPMHRLCNRLFPSPNLSSQENKHNLTSTDLEALWICSHMAEPFKLGCWTCNIILSHFDAPSCVQGSRVPWNCFYRTQFYWRIILNTWRPNQFIVPKPIIEHVMT